MNKVHILLESNKTKKGDEGTTVENIRGCPWQISSKTTFIMSL